MSATTNKADPLTFYAGMIAPLLIAAWLLPVILLRAWVITMLWAWYIVPGFNVAPLRISIAFGLSTLVAMLTPGKDAVKEKKTFATLVVMSFFNQLIPLAFGLVGSFFV